MARPRAWADFLLSMVLAPGTAQSVDLLTSAVNSDTITVGRLIGRIHVHPDSLTAQVDFGATINVGIGVASADAFGVGTAALAGIATAADAPARGWLYRSQMHVTKVHSSGTDYEYGEDDTLAFDVRAMRKVDKGVLYFTAQSTSVVGTAGSLRLTGIIRAMCLT